MVTYALAKSHILLGSGLFCELLYQLFIIDIIIAIIHTSLSTVARMVLVCYSSLLLIILQRKLTNEKTTIFN